MKSLIKTKGSSIVIDSIDMAFIQLHEEDVDLGEIEIKYWHMWQPMISYSFSDINHTLTIRTKEKFMTFKLDEDYETVCI